MTSSTQQLIHLNAALISEFRRVGAGPVLVNCAVNTTESGASVHTDESVSVFRIPVSRKKTDTI